MNLSSSSHSISVMCLLKYDEIAVMILSSCVQHVRMDETMCELRLGVVPYLWVGPARCKDQMRWR